MKKKNILISTLTPLVLSSAVLPLTNVIGLNQTKNLNYIKTSESTASIIDDYGTKWDVKFYDAEKEENRYCEVISFIVGFNKAKEEQLVNKVIIPEKFTFEEKDYKLTKISNCILGTDVKQIEFLTFYDAKNLVEIADNCFKNIKIKKISWVGCYNLKIIGDYAFSGVGVASTKEDNIIDFSATVLEKIGSHAFYNFGVGEEETGNDFTQNAWEIFFPKTLKEIGDYAFNGETLTKTDKDKKITGIVKTAIGAALIVATIVSSAMIIKKQSNNKSFSKTLKNVASVKKSDFVKKRKELDDLVIAKTHAEIEYDDIDSHLSSLREKNDKFTHEYNDILNNPNYEANKKKELYSRGYYWPSTIDEMYRKERQDVVNFYNEKIATGQISQEINTESYNLGMKYEDVNEIQNKINIKEHDISLSEGAYNATVGKFFEQKKSAISPYVYSAFESVLGLSGCGLLGWGITDLTNCHYIVDKAIQFNGCHFLGDVPPKFGENWAPRGLNFNSDSSKIFIPKNNSSSLLNSSPLNNYLNAKNATYKADGKIENTGKDITPAMYQESKIWFDETSNDENVYKLTGFAGISSKNDFSWKANHVQEKCAHKENAFYNNLNRKIYNQGELADKYGVRYQLSRAPKEIFIDQSSGKICWSDELKPGTYHFNVTANLFEYTSDPQNPNVLLGSDYYNFVDRAQSKEITLTILPNSKLLQIQTPSTITATSTSIVINFNGKREFDFDYGDEYLKTTLITDHPDKIKIEGEKIIIADDLPSGTYTFTLNVERKYVVGTTSGGTSFETKVVKQSKQFTYTK